MSGRVLFTVAVMVVFVAAIVYTALCAQSRGASATASATRSAPAVTDAAIARLLDDETPARTAA